jgi:hypothetical protein
MALRRVETSLGLLWAAVVLLTTIEAAVAGYWDGTWTAHPADGDATGVLIIVISGNNVSWWVPDDLTMRQGEDVASTATTLTFDVGAGFGGARITLRSTGPNSAERVSDRHSANAVPIIAIREPSTEPQCL